MKKVGTQVELDLSSVLKEFNAAYAAVVQQRKGWRAWDAVVKRTFPTLKQASAALKQTAGRMDELRHTQEGSTTAGKQEINIRQAQVKSLRRVIAEYKETEKALGTLAKAEAKAAAETQAAWAAHTAAITKDLERKQQATEKAAEAVAQAERMAADEVAKANEKAAQAAEKAANQAEKAHMQRQRAAEQTAKKEVKAAEQVAKAAERAAKARERYTKAVRRNARQVALWVAGSASAYRLIMKIRREIEETIEQLYGSTEQYKALTIAVDKYKISLLSILGTESEVIDFLGRMADGISQGADQFNIAIAAIRGFTAGTIMLLGDLTDVEGKTKAAAHALEVYNALIQSYSKQAEKAAEENEELTKKTEGFGKAVDDIRKRLADYNKALYQIEEERFTGLLDAQRDYNQGIVELELDRQRTVEDNAIAAARRLEDIQLDAARRMAALERDFNKQLESAKRDYGKGIRKAAEALAQKLLDIERRYQDKLLDIERAYAYSIYDAISTRDATAALQAMRRRKDDLADAKRDREQARGDAFSDYARRIRDLRESLAEQERIARQSYQDQLEELRRSLAEQEEDYQISLRRREEDAELSYARSLRDLQKAFLDRLVAIQAQNALERANAVSDYLLRENAYARHLARMAAIYQSYQTVSAPSTPSFGMPTIPPPIPFAKGGTMIVNQPTLAIFGEAGPELVIAQPLPPASQGHNITGSVAHQVNATISQSIAGMEGRIAGAVQQALADVIR